MRRWAAAVFVLAVLVPAQASGLGDMWRWSKNGWHTFTSPDGVFTVSYKHKPSHRTDPCELDSGAKVPGHSYLSMNNHTAQQVLVCDLTTRSDIVDPLEHQVQILKANGAVFLSDQPDTIGDHVGRRIEYTGSNKWYAVQRLFLVGRTFYTVYGTYPADPDPVQKDEVTHFAQSFHFTDSGPGVKEDAD